jgi:hypothetical protein
MLLDELNAVLREGMEQGWASAPAQGSLAQILQTADERAVATSRLDDLMKTTAMSRPKRPPIGRIAAALVACGLVGAGAAALLRSDSLLARAQYGPERSDDVLGQLYQAKLVDTEDGWRAVAANFPDADKYYHNLAREGLLYYYLTKTQDYEKAIREAEELTSAAEADFRAVGLAGLVIAYVHLGDDAQAMYANQLLDPEQRAALVEQSPRMAQLLDQAYEELVDRQL